MIVLTHLSICPQGTVQAIGPVLLKLGIVDTYYILLKNHFDCDIVWLILNTT
jgi:hypothetical protein